MVMEVFLLYLKKYVLVLFVFRLLLVLPLGIISLSSDVDFENALHSFYGVTYFSLFLIPFIELPFSLHFFAKKSDTIPTTKFWMIGFPALAVLLSAFVTVATYFFIVRLMTLLGFSTTFLNG